MGDRISIYAGPPVMRLIGQVPVGFRSGRLNAAIDRYLAIVQDELLHMQLTRNEWLALMDALNGAQVSDTTGDAISWRSAWASLYDAHETLDEKWGVDSRELALRVRDMTIATKAALFEAAVGFWLAASSGEQDEGRLLAAVGVVPVE
jgi:hypothetical protein